MPIQANTPDPPKRVPAPQSLYPALTPRPEQGVNPNAQRQQEQAQQQLQQ